MCTYHGVAHLRQQLESLLCQTLQPAECLICDDRSEDETVTMLEQFRSLAPFPVRIVVNEKNIGSTRNFDQALELATGEFLALCDQDDIWHPQKLATLASILSADTELGGAFSDSDLIETTGKTIKAPRSNRSQTLWGLHGFNPGKQQRFVEGGAIDMLLKHDVVTGATLMVRASLRSTWHPIPPSWVHDGWITWMLAIHSRLAAVPEPLISYRVHAQQQVGTGGGSRLEKLRRIQRTERSRYAAVATQFEDLRDRVQQLQPHNVVLIEALNQKITFTKQRSLLPHSFLARVLWLLTHLFAYRRYARGWRSLRKDMVLF